MSAYLSRLRLQFHRDIEVLIFQYLIATLLDQMLPTVRSCASAKRCFEEQPVCFVCLSRLLLDCRFPCVWTNSTTASLASKLRSVHLTVAKPPDYCPWIVPQDFLKTVCSRNFQDFSDGRSSSSSTMCASSRPA